MAFLSLFFLQKVLKHIVKLNFRIKNRPREGRSGSLSCYCQSNDLPVGLGLPVSGAAGLYFGSGFSVAWRVISGFRRHSCSVKLRLSCGGFSGRRTLLNDSAAIARVFRR